jgi:hypothetical protein
MKWAIIIVVGLGGLVGLGYLRNSYLPRRRLERFLCANGVDFVSLNFRPTYAWPGYVVAFDSKEKSRAFRASPAFEAFLREVQTIHDNVGPPTNRFDARLAVSLDPKGLDASS